MIHYSHHKNIHGTEGPKVALPIILRGKTPNSLIDVGCGIGTWMAAAVDAGITDVRGLDGVIAPTEQLVVPPELITEQDFRQDWRLGRRFDVALCLEVAEHLDEETGDRLVASLCEHSELVIFSAAAPFQEGDHHVNCQWPAYWQEKFNREGFACEDSIRWTLWDNTQIDPWYRQNLFIAYKSQEAGAEEKIRSVYHPEMVPYLVPALVFPKQFAKRSKKKLLRRILGK
jgi:hypothetical protein